MFILVEIIYDRFLLLILSCCDFVLLKITVNPTDGFVGMRILFRISLWAEPPAL